MTRYREIDTVEVSGSNFPVGMFGFFYALTLFKKSDPQA
jgi:hypothetical protein